MRKLCTFFFQSCNKSGIIADLFAALYVLFRLDLLSITDMEVSAGAAVSLRECLLCSRIS